MNKCPHCQTENTEDAEKCGNCHKNLAVAAIVADLNTALSRAETVEGEKVALVAERDTVKSQLEAAMLVVTSKDEQLTEKDGLLTTKEQELKDKADELTAAQAKMSELNEKVRQSRLSAHFDDAKWGERKTTLMAMAEDAFEIYASDLDAAVLTASKGGVGLRLPDPDAGGKSKTKDKEPLVLGK